MYPDQEYASANARERVLSMLNRVPAGSVVSYGQLAELAGLGKAARQVGQILRSLPEDTRLPWHRVVNASGGISLPEPGRSMQVERLEVEAVTVREGRVDINRHRWNPAESNQARRVYQ